MAEYRKIVEGKTVVGQQQSSLRVTIPQEISNVIKINPGDTLKWQFDPTQKKPIITIEVEESDTYTSKSIIKDR